MTFFKQNNHLFISVLFSLSLFMASCANADTNKNNKPAKPPKAKATANITKQDTTKLPDAPDFTLKTMDGDSFTLSKHKGQVIVLNLWATWCPPCREEIPDFIDLQNKLRDKGVLFVGVSLDKKGWKAVRPFAKKYNINYPVMIDNGTVIRQYGPVRGIPTTFIINKKGKVEYATVGMLNTKALKPVLIKLANR